MKAADRQRARDIVGTLLDACLPEPGRHARAVTTPAPRALPVTGTVRCWTPFRDWQRGEAAIESLRQVLSGYCSLLPDDANFETTALISDGSTVVAEAIAPVPGRDAASLTVVFTLDSDRVDEIRCYADPRAFGLSSGHPARSEADTAEG